MELDTVAESLRRMTVEVTSGGRGLGAGVVWAPEWIVTNAHVIAHAPVAVRAAGGRRLEGTVIARDDKADLAVLRVPDLDLPAATCAECDRPRIGSLVIAIGHPFGLRGALTVGIVHAIGAITRGGRRWIQSDLRLAPGNSGGPLADARGRLLGLNAMVVGGLAMAISAGEVDRFVRAIRS